MGWGGYKQGASSEQGSSTYSSLSLRSSSSCLFGTAFEGASVENSILAADFASGNTCKLSFCLFATNLHFTCLSFKVNSDKRYLGGRALKKM